jgi:hypothetical protein
MLLAPAVDFHFDFPGQLTAEIVNVHSRAAIDLGWKLACK